MSAASGIGRASLFLASGTVVSRILGFVKAIVLAQTIGVVGSASADAFAIANQLPNNIYVIVAGGVLSAVLVPQIVRAGLHQDGGRGYINKLITVALVVLSVAAVAATLLAPALTWISGTQLSGEQLALAITFAYWCLPQIFFYGLYTVLGEVLNARKSFGPFTWAPVLNNVVAIAGLVVFIVLFGSDPNGHRAANEWTTGMVSLLAGSATLGVAAQALILFYFWRRIGLRYRPDFSWRGVGLGTAGRMAGWTFGMLLITQLAGIVETNVAGIASDDGPSVAALANAWLIFMLPHSVITVSVATAYFTRMSEHAAAGSLRDIRSDVSSAARSISLIIVLASAVLIVVAYPFSRVFTRDFSDVQAFGDVIIAYVLGLVAFSLLFVIQRTFYALGDTRTPFFFTLFQVVLVIIGALGSAFLPKPWIAVGIALVITISGTLQTLLAGYLLRRRIHGIDGRRIAKSLLRYLGAAALPLVLGFVVLRLLGGTHEGGFAVSGIAPAILSMIAIGTVMALTYLVMLVVLRTPELRTLAAPLLRRVKR